jgi:phage shock protein A
MFGWLKRLFGIIEAEGNAALNSLEDPVKMTEQGIRDLKTDLQKSMQSLAEVKSLSLRTKGETEAMQKQVAEYENKAILLLKKAQNGEIDATEADRLAGAALDKKSSIEKNLQTALKNQQQYDGMVSQMQDNVNKLKTQIGEWETELKSLRARSTVSKATSKVNKQLANIDSDGTIQRLQRMREKVEAQESLAVSYGEIAAQSNSTVDDEIDKVLGAGAGSSNPQLEALKKQLSEGGSKSSDSNDSSASSGGENPASGNSELDKLKQQLKDS